MDSSGEKRTVTLQRNPLLINTVINCVFEYLSLEDLKQCRVVCQEWNALSVPILNKQFRVKLDCKEVITNFLEFYKDYDTQAFPFTNFLLMYSHTNGNTEECEQLLDLFNTLRGNIITLTFINSGDKHDLTPFIELATNLVSLTLESHNSAIELNTLAKVKYISLYGCSVSLDSFENRIAPLSIFLNYVTFERNDNTLPEILVNDYIDFGRCSEIEVRSSNTVMTFDMSRDAVSARTVYFHRTRLINCRETQEKVVKRMLPLENHTLMGIKELFFNSPELNLSVLPKSLEKLSLYMDTYDTSNCAPINLPNLKYLSVGIADESPTAYDMGIITSKFRICPKLVDMELVGSWFNDWPCDIKVDLMPANLKRIKFTNSKNINFVGDTVFHVHILILNEGTFADAQQISNKIKPKIFVVELGYYGVEDPDAEIVSFIETSRNLEKTLIKIPDDDNQLHQAYERALSIYVDDEDDDIASKCYEFTNQVGKRITKKEFEMYWF